MESLRRTFEIISWAFESLRKVFENSRSAVETYNRRAGKKGALLTMRGKRKSAFGVFLISIE